MSIVTRTRRAAAAAVVLAAASLSLIPAAPAFAQAAIEAPADGVVRMKSANSFDETLVRLKADVQAKGIRFFDAIDQAARRRVGIERRHPHAAVVEVDRQEHWPYLASDRALAIG